MKKIILISFLILTCNLFYAQSTSYNLGFSQAILVEGTSLSVPSGKVWKVVSVQRSEFNDYTARMEMLFMLVADTKMELLKIKE